MSIGNVHSTRPDVDTDDPTRALDDFVRRMRPDAWRRDESADLTDLSSLRARLHPEPPVEQPAAPAAPKGGRLRNGQVWRADDVEDVPVVELPTVRPPEVLDTDDLDSALQGAARFAALQLDAEAEAARAPAWQPDLQTLQLRAPRHPRELTLWQPGAWIGASRQVLKSHTDVINRAGGPTVESHEPLRLLLLWPPQRIDAPMTSRWPQRVQVATVAADAAAAQLLSQLPEDALLWMTPQADDIDWALAADIALHHESGLLAYQIDGLRAFIEAERTASFAALNGRYQQAAAGAAILQR